MALITYQIDNQGFYIDFGMNDFSYSGTTANGDIYEYSGGSYDPTRSAYSIEFYYDGATGQTATEGDNAGQFFFTGGTITDVVFRNQSNDIILTISGLSTDLIYVGNNMIYEDFYSAWQEIFNTRFEVQGTNNSGNTNWTGDDIQTGYRNDKVKAGGGDDFIKDVGGKDVYNGQKGFDTVSYEDSIWNPRATERGIVANLAKGWIKGPDLKKDVVKSIEGVEGTFKNDVFKGSGKNESFTGFHGNDTFNGGGGGDWVRYDKDERRGGNFGIEANLATGQIRDGFGYLDTVEKIEHIRGTSFSDTMIDNNKDNWFLGFDGDDTFTFSKGNDWVRGGGGTDFFIFKGNAFGNDVIDDFDDGGEQIWIQNAGSFGELTFSNIEGDGIEPGDKLIEWNGNSIRLNGLEGVTLTEDDFFFGP